MKSRAAPRVLIVIAVVVLTGWWFFHRRSGPADDGPPDVETWLMLPPLYGAVAQIDAPLEAWCPWSEYSDRAACLDALEFFHRPPDPGNDGYAVHAGRCIARDRVRQRPRRERQLTAVAEAFRDAVGGHAEVRVVDEPTDERLRHEPYLVVLPRAQSEKTAEGPAGEAVPLVIVFVDETSARETTLPDLTDYERRGVGDVWIVRPAVVNFPSRFAEVLVLGRTKYYPSQFSIIDRPMITPASRPRVIPLSSLPGIDVRVDGLGGCSSS